MEFKEWMLSSRLYITSSYFTTRLLQEEVGGIDEEETKVGISKTAKQQAVFLQIVPVKAKSKGGNFISTHALLDSGSGSTLTRAGVWKRLELDGTTKLVITSSVKNTGETIRVKEVKL